MLPDVKRNQEKTHLEQRGGAHEIRRVGVGFYLLCGSYSRADQVSLNDEGKMSSMNEN